MLRFQFLVRLFLCAALASSGFEAMGASDDGLSDGNRRYRERPANSHFDGLARRFEKKAEDSLHKTYGEDLTKAMVAGGSVLYACKAAVFLYDALNASSLFSTTLAGTSEEICKGIGTAAFGVAATPLVGRVAGGYWTSFKSFFGYYEPPTGLVRVMPRSSQNPDGALERSALIYDPAQLSTAKLKSSVEAMLRGDRLRSGIYYGDAGTGKTSSVRAFAHEKGFRVYSISGPELNSFAAFRKLKEWLDRTATPQSKILVDISEGDDILFNIAENPLFRNYFKKNFETEHSSYALIFSCNFNEVINEALRSIKTDEALSRRLPERIRFSAPSAPVRVALLKRSVFEQLDQYFPADRNARNFFSDFFQDQELISGVVERSTQGFSHNQISSIGKKIVYLYREAREELAKGTDPNFLEYGYLSGSALNEQSPLVRIREYLFDHSEETKWLIEENKRLIQQDINDIEEKMPLLLKKAELRKAQYEAEERVFGRPQRKPQNRGVYRHAVDLDGDDVDD